MTYRITGSSLVLAGLLAACQPADTGTPATPDETAAAGQTAPAVTQYDAATFHQTTSSASPPRPVLPGRRMTAGS